MMAAEQSKQQQKQQDAVSTEYLVHNWLEALFAWFQVIVLWHEPNVSFCAISGLLSSFLLFTYFTPRFYAFIMIALFIYNLNKFWFRYVWPEIRVPLEGDRELEMRLDVDRWTLLHPQLMTLNELKYHIRNLIKSSEYHLQKLFLLRHRKPAAFCSILCFVFTCTAYIGNRVSGLSLIFCTLLIIMSAPGIYAHFLSEDYKSWLQQHVQILIAPHDIEASLEHAAAAAADDDDDGGGGGGGGSEKNESDESQDQQQQQQAPKSTLRSANVYKETIATSLTSTIKSIETLFDNLKRKNQILPRATATATTTTTTEPATNIQTEMHPTTSVLANFREDGAKALINLIDVTLMSGNKDRPEATTGDSTRSQHERRRTSSECSSVDESVPLVDPEGDQQDDGFVIL